MGNYFDLIAAINAAIKTNGEQGITGASLNAILRDMVAALGAGYQYVGVVTPDAAAPSTDYNAVYLGLTAGTYTNFGGTQVRGGQFGVFTFNGSWTYNIADIASGTFVRCDGEQELPEGEKENARNNIDAASKAEVNAKYTKPSGGIPKTDLAQAVQDSLDEVSQLGQEVTGIIGGRELLSGWVNTSYIPTSQGVGNVCPKNIIPNQPLWRTIIVDIPQYIESYIINGTGGGTPRLWCFLDENDVILSVAAPSASGSGDALIINVPEGATQLIINSSTSGDCFAYSTGILPSLQESVNNLQDEMEESQEDTNLRFKSVEYSIDTGKPYNLINHASMIWTPGAIYPNGNIAETQNYSVSDYIPIEPSYGHIYLGMITTVQYYNEETQQQILNVGAFLHQQYCCFFDKNKDVIVTTINSNPSKQIPENAAFIRVTAQASYYNFTCLIYGNYNEQTRGRVVDYRLTLPNSFKFSNTGYEHLKMVAFGDSLTHGRFSEDTGKPSESWPDFANDELRGNIINCGFGGTRMMGGNLFSFINLCKTLVSEASDKWDAYDAYVVEHTEFAYNLTTLKGINWEEIDAISIWYGANDFPNDAPIGSSYNEDENTFDGACAAGIKLLLQKYPHLQILILSPIWGIRGGLNVDTEANGAGLLMIDYVNSLKRISDRVHCPVVDLYHTTQFNDINKLVYSTDATHIRSLVGFKRLAHIIAEQIKLYVTPKYI